MSSMDSTSKEPASAPYESDPLGETEGNPSQNPSSPVPHDILVVEDAGKPHNPWPAADKELLMSLRNDGMSFRDISKRFTDRSARACRLLYDRVLETMQKLREEWPWTSSEEQLLFSLHKAGYPPKKVGDEFPERIGLAVKVEWEYMDAPVDYEDDYQWTELEDQQLQDFHKAGNDWMSIARLMPGLRRTAGDCLVRYLQTHGSLPYPCPTASAFPWAPEEIAFLIRMRDQGRDWVEIASQLPDHDAVDCRNYWYNNHWDDYREWFKDGQIDMSRYAKSSKNTAS